MDTVLVVNAGSSSIKFQVFEVIDTRTLTRLIKGQVDGIGSRPRLRARVETGGAAVDKEFSVSEVGDVPAATRMAAAWLQTEYDIEPDAVGHRVVHGGPRYDRPVLIDSDVLRTLERYVPLAPLHQPNNLSPINAIRARFPDLPQVACFDTAFHRGHDPLADHYAIPEALYSEGVRRYGFHGLSYEYIARHLRKTVPTVANRRVIVAHLGSGASMCALSDGRSVESTMGFTALDGLPMGTRPGQIDPGVILYLMRQKGLGADAVETVLYRKCGLKGLSGVSNDVRELLASDDPRARFAIDYFVYRVGLNAGMLAAALGGIDAFVFTAGIGENAPSLRARIVERLAWLGARLDPASNEINLPVISSEASGMLILVVPTDEELMIAHHTLEVLSQTKPVTLS